MYRCTSPLPFVVVLLLLALDVKGWLMLWRPTRHLQLGQRRVGNARHSFWTAASCGSLAQGTSTGRPLPIGFLPRLTMSSRADLDSAEANNDPSDDEGCASEEECEIDWDSMPGFAEDDDSSSSSSNTSYGTGATASPSTQQRHQLPSIESSRLRLEMMWQLHEAAEDCEVDRPQTCGSQPCGRCRGRGTLPCRFCGGKRILGFTRGSPTATSDAVEAFYACTVCDHGVEACGACRGTGWVAEWTALSHGVTTN